MKTFKKKYNKSNKKKTYRYTGGNTDNLTEVKINITESVKDLVEQMPSLFSYLIFALANQQKPNQQTPNQQTPNQQTSNQLTLNALPNQQVLNNALANALPNQQVLNNALANALPNKQVLNNALANALANQQTPNALDNQQKPNALANQQPPTSMYTRLKNFKGPMQRLREWEERQNEAYYDAVFQGGRKKKNY